MSRELIQDRSNQNIHTSSKQTLRDNRFLETSETMAVTSKLNILVVGSGGREHALVQKCRQSPLADRVIAAPGNGGMANEVDCYNISVEDVVGMVNLAKAEDIGLVVVGPEIPLSLGLVDALQAEGSRHMVPKKTELNSKPARLSARTSLPDTIFQPRNTLISPKWPQRLTI